jgi:hypothetical protein
LFFPLSQYYKGKQQDSYGCAGYSYAPIVSWDTPLPPPNGTTVLAFAICGFEYRGESRKKFEDGSTAGFSCQVLCGKERGRGPFNLAGFEITPLGGTGWNDEPLRAVLISEERWEQLEPSERQKEAKESITDDNDLTAVLRDIDQEAARRGWTLVKDSWGEGNAGNEARTIPYQYFIGQFTEKRPLLLDVGSMPFDYYDSSALVFWIVAASVGGVWVLMIIGQMCWTLIVTRKKHPV